MSEEQKNNIEKYLKEKGVTKRELANKLGIKENSVNRLLKNPRISVFKLETIANVLEVSVQDLLSKNTEEMSHEQIKSEDEFKKLNPIDSTKQLAINSLSEALNRNSKTIDKLVDIIAENFPNKMLSKPF